jgi:hypothetical protein
MRVDSANADLWIGEAGAHQHLMPAGDDPFDETGLDLVDGVQQADSRLEAECLRLLAMDPHTRGIKRVEIIRV